jgi:O-methyltransferase
MKLFIIRYTKIAFSYLQLHRFFGLFNSLFLNILYLTKFSSWIRKNRNISYNDFPSKWDYHKRYNMYLWVLEQENLLNAPITYLEFGVAHGESIRWFSDQIKNPSSTFHGFDTFTGLPEDFGGMKKGYFDNNNSFPEVNDSRIHFYKGLFQDSLPPFLKQPVMLEDKRKVIMLDADLYSATLFTLTTLSPYLNKGDIILFDEFAVPTHEFKAFSDFSESYYIKLDLIAAANNYYFVAFKVV